MTELLYKDTAEEVSDEKTFNAQEISKILSDYMLYLLVLKPTILNYKENDIWKHSWILSQVIK